jgi:hypothetical protein
MTKNEIIKELGDYGVDVTDPSVDREMMNRLLRKKQNQTKKESPPISPSMMKVSELRAAIENLTGAPLPNKYITKERLIELLSKYTTEPPPPSNYEKQPETMTEQELLEELSTKYRLEPVGLPKWELVGLLRKKRNTKYSSFKPEVEAAEKARNDAEAAEKERKEAASEKARKDAEAAEKARKDVEAAEKAMKEAEEAAEKARKEAEAGQKGKVGNLSIDDAIKFNSLTRVNYLSDILGLSLDELNTRTVQKTFRKMALKFHPDKSLINGLTPEISNTILQILSDVDGELSSDDRIRLYKKSMTAGDYADDKLSNWKNALYKIVEREKQEQLKEDEGPTPRTRARTKKLQEEDAERLRKTMQGEGGGKRKTHKKKGSRKRK